jgi:hypothetical protein
MAMNENEIKERLKFILLVTFAPLALSKLNTNKGEEINSMEKTRR